MTYSLSQILVGLVAVAGLAFAAGLLWRRWRGGIEMAMVRDDFNDELAYGSEALELAQIRLATADSTLISTQNEREALSLELADRERQAATLRAESADHSRLLSEANRELRAARAELDQLGPLLEKRATEIAVLTGRLELLGAVEDRHARCGSTVAALEAQLEQTTAALESARTHELRATELEHTLAERALRLERLELAVDSSRQILDAPDMPANAGRRPAGNDVGGDDLRRIYGIGKVIERRLRALGVHRYEQISAWASDQIEHYAEQVGCSSERIRRDGWIESAARLVDLRNAGGLAETDRRKVRPPEQPKPQQPAARAAAQLARDSTPVSRSVNP